MVQWTHVLDSREPRQGLCRAVGSHAPAHPRVAGGGRRALRLGDRAEGGHLAGPAFASLEGPLRCGRRNADPAWTATVLHARSRCPRSGLRAPLASPLAPVDAPRVGGSFTPSSGSRRMHSCRRLLSRALGRKLWPMGIGTLLVSAEPPFRAVSPVPISSKTPCVEGLERRHIVVGINTKGYTFPSPHYADD